MASDDGGRSWTPRGRITNDPEGNHYYNETAVYQCESGKLVAFMRVEQDPDRRSHTSVSHDRGRTWSPVGQERIKGYPFQAARLRSGRVMLAYGYRFDPGAYLPVFWTPNARGWMKRRSWCCGMTAPSAIWGLPMSCRFPTAPRW